MIELDEEPVDPSLAASVRTWMLGFYPTALGMLDALIILELV